MFIPRSFDKTLILIINCTSVMLVCCIVLTTFATVVDLPSASNGYWGLALVAQHVADSCFNLAL